MQAPGCVALVLMCVAATTTLIRIRITTITIPLPSLLANLKSDGPQFFLRVMLSGVGGESGQTQAFSAPGVPGHFGSSASLGCREAGIKKHNLMQLGGNSSQRAAAR